MLAEAWKGTQLAFLRCLFKLIRWDANHQGHRQNKASRQIAFLHYIRRRIYIFIFKALAPMFNLEIQSQRYRYSIYIYTFGRTGMLQYAHRKSKWRRTGEEKGESKAGSGWGGMLNTPLKLRTWLEREGNWTKLQRVHISLSRLLALRHHQHLSSRPCC